MKLNATDSSSIYDDGLIYDLIHVPGKRLDELFYKSLSLPGQDVLEVACGTGRLTIPLAQAGVEITGLDISMPMLERAREKSRQLGLDIQWIHADARTFELGKKFQLVFIPCNSLQHLYRHKDVVRFFENVKAHLQPGGIFAFDIFKPDLKILSRDPDRMYEVLTYKNENGEEIHLEEKNLYDQALQINKIQWIHLNNKREIIRTDHLEMRQFFPQEIEALLAAAGFRISEKFGSWNREPVDSTSVKQLIVATVD